MNGCEEPVEFKTVWMRGVHPVKIKSVLSEELQDRVKSLDNPELTKEEAIDILSEICIDSRYSSGDLWPILLKNAKNWRNVARLFMEAY